MYGPQCSGAAPSACVQEQRPLWQQCAQLSATKVTVMPSYGNTKPDSIATHAFCVRLRFKLCKAQTVAQPSASVARGASRPSVPFPDAVSQPRSAERRYELCAELSGATRASVTNPSERAWIPHPDTERAAFTASKAAC